jgi:NMD protein affecting ribosome stability and mRNA decay
MNMLLIIVDRCIECGEPLTKIEKRIGNMCSVCTYEAAEIRREAQKETGDMTCQV